MKNQRRRTEEDLRKAEIYNALTFGLSGLIKCARSLREETKLIEELREKIRQKKSLKQKPSGEGGRKEP